MDVKVIASYLCQFILDKPLYIKDVLTYFAFLKIQEGVGHASKTSVDSNYAKYPCAKNTESLPAGSLSALPPPGNVYSG